MFRLWGTSISTLDTLFKEVSEKSFNIESFKSPIFINKIGQELSNPNSAKYNDCLVALLKQEVGTSALGELQVNQPIEPQEYSLPVSYCLLSSTQGRTVLRHLISNQASMIDIMLFDPEFPMLNLQSPLAYFIAFGLFDDVLVLIEQSNVGASKVIRHLMKYNQSVLELINKSKGQKILQHLLLKCFDEEAKVGVLLLGMLLRDFSDVKEQLLDMINSVLEQVRFEPLLLEMLIENDLLSPLLYRIAECKSCYLVNWVKDPSIWSKVGDTESKLLAQQLTKSNEAQPSLFKLLSRFESGRLVLSSFQSNRLIYVWMIQTDSTILYQFPTLDLECAHYEFLINHLFVLSAQYEVFFENKKIAELFSLAMTPRGRKIIELIFARLGKNPRAKQSKYAIDFLNHQSPEFGGMLSLLIKGDGFSALTQIFNVIRDDESREPEVLAGTIKLLMHMIPKIDNILSLGTLLSSANGIRCLAEILAISSNDNRSIQLILDAIITECISIKGTNHLTYMELMFHTGQGIELFTIICEYCSTIMIQYDELICNIWSEKSGQLLHHACKLSEEDGYNTLFYVFAKYQMKQCIALLASTDAAEINTDWLVSALVAKSSEITSDSSIIKMLSKPGNSWLIKSIKDMLLHVNISKQHKDDLIAAMAERGYGTQRSIRQALEGLATGREVITYIESKSSSTQVSLFTSPIKRISRLVVGPAL